MQQSRERLVIAREEERRRIRNDLHDGLAPTLSSLQLQLGAVRSLMRQNPEQAEAMINDLREDLRRLPLKSDSWFTTCARRCWMIWD